MIGFSTDNSASCVTAYLFPLSVIGALRSPTGQVRCPIATLSKAAGSKPRARVSVCDVKLVSSEVRAVELRSNVNSRSVLTHLDDYPTIVAIQLPAHIGTARLR